MLKVVFSSSFKNDFKLAKKRNFDIKLLNEVINKLAKQEKLDAKYKDHKLSGEYKDFRECHIKPNWLLIYKIEKDELELFLLRTGTHSDLF